MRMLFIVFCKQIVYTFYATIKYLIHMSILWAIARTYYAATIVTSLIPVSYLHKDISCPSEYLSVPGIFKFNRICFIPFWLLGHT